MSCDNHSTLDMGKIESIMYVIIFDNQNANILSLGKANKAYFCRIHSFILPLYGN